MFIVISNNKLRMVVNNIIFKNCPSDNNVKPDLQYRSVYYNDDVKLL